MRILKVIALGTLFSITALPVMFVAGLVLGSGHIEIDMQGSHAMGLSALVAGVVFNPIVWGIIVLSFAGAYWVVRKTAIRHDRVRQAS